MALVRRIGSVGPKSNVPEVSQPWARDLEARLQALEVDTGITKRGIVTARSNTETQATFQTIQQGMIKGVRADLTQFEIESELFREEVEQELEQSKERLDEAQDELDNLNNVVLPGLDTRLNDMQQEIDDIVVEAGGNTITYSVNAPSSTGGYTEGDTWFQIDGSGNILGQWEFDGDDWQSRQIESEFIANLDAGKINTGFLDAARIQARTITAEKLIISTGTNLLTNPDFSGDAAGWEQSSWGYFESGGFNDMPFTRSTASSSLRGNRLGNGTAQPEYKTDVPEGGVVRLKAMYRSASAVAAGGVQLYLGYRDFSNVPIGYDLFPSTQATAANTWGELSEAVTVPEDTASVVFGVYVSGSHTAAVDFSNLSMLRMSDAELIVDGSITGEKIQSNSITANDAVFATGAIQSADIGELVADKITTGTLSGIDITGVNITGTNTLTGGSLNVVDGNITVTNNGRPTFQTSSDYVEIAGANVAAGGRLRVTAIPGSTAPALRMSGMWGQSEAPFLTVYPLTTGSYTSQAHTELLISKSIMVGDNNVPAEDYGLFPYTGDATDHYVWGPDNWNVSHAGDSRFMRPALGTRTRTATQTVSGNTPTRINMTSWKYTPRNLTAASGGIRVQRPGLYAIMVVGVFTGAQDSTRVGVHINGTERWSQIAVADGSLRRLYATHMEFLWRDDLVQMFANTTASGSVTLAATSELTVTRVST